MLHREIFTNKPNKTETIVPIEREYIMEMKYLFMLGQTPKFKKITPTHTHTQ